MKNIDKRALIDAAIAARERSYSHYSGFAVGAALLTDEGKAVSTLYTSCIDTAARTYYFTTYNDRQIRAVVMTDELISLDRLTVRRLADI